ncbi:TIGR03756 family integrating conjugative element protein, partial [Escherichia coli]|nr:TIGR03756 family integrating conjugative element protein [Escherichia coli]
MTELQTRRYAGAFLLWTATVSVAGASLNTAQIVASAVSQSCISWRVSGICYWLYCT